MTAGKIAAVQAVLKELKIEAKLLQHEAGQLNVLSLLQPSAGFFYSLCLTPCLPLLLAAQS
jgi:hypothetical protein